MSNSLSLEEQIQLRLNQLTKPLGSLGELETLAARYCIARGVAMPSLPRKTIYVFCADHGIVEEGVSLYPQEVTRQMVFNFQRGGAAINVLCRAFGIEAVVVDAGVAGDPIGGIVNLRVGAGTRNFARERAMTREQAMQAIDAGKKLAREASTHCDLAGIGEMGIGNTSSAAAIFSALTRTSASETTGRGTGLDAAGVAHKAEVIRAALQKHLPDAADPVDVLSAVGGFEIAMMAGFLLGAYEVRLPVVVDGYITAAAALIAHRLYPESLSTAFFSHRSAEAGHRSLLAELGATPPLDLGMRLGEGTGAALAMNLIDTALKLYLEMATFGEAAVSEAVPS